jgi:hypothetical protein
MDNRPQAAATKAPPRTSVSKLFQLIAPFAAVHATIAMAVPLRLKATLRQKNILYRTPITVPLSQRGTYFHGSSLSVSRLLLFRQATSRAIRILRRRRVKSCLKTPEIMMKPIIHAITCVFVMCSSCQSCGSGAAFEGEVFFSPKKAASCTRRFAVYTIGT